MFFGQLTGVWEITDTTRHSTAKEYQYLRGGYSGETSKGRACTAQRGNFRTIRSPETARRFTPVWRQTSRSVHWRGALDAHAGLGTANAQSASDAQVKALQAQIEQL